jgi:Na+-transporting NADH:ubiquinone oxidoreductase subunit NqrD
MTPLWRNVQIAASLIGFCAILAAETNFSKAAAVTLSVVVAYFLEFYFLRQMLNLIASRKFDRLKGLVGLLAIAVGVVLIYANYGVFLAMAFVCIFLLDALILRFGMR